MKESNGSLDTNVLIRLIICDDPYQTNAALQHINNGTRFHIADVALIETIFALERYYDVPRKEIREIVIALAGNPKLVFNRELFLQVIEMYAVRPKLSIEDCCLAFYAKLNNALPLWTFDAKLAKQGDGLTALLS